MPKRYTALHILLSSGGRLLFWVRIRRERLPLSFFGRDLKGMGGERLVYSSSLRFSSLTRSHWPNMGCPWKALPLERHSGMINKFNIPLLLFWSWDSKRMGGKGLFLIAPSLLALLTNEVTGRRETNSIFLCLLVGMQRTFQLIICFPGASHSSIRKMHFLRAISS